MIGWQTEGQRLLTNKMVYNSFDQNVLLKLPDVKLYDSTGNLVSLKDSEKIIILDFWNSTCGPCYRLFPTIDSVRKKLDQTKYDIRVVNIPLNGEVKKDNYRLLNKYHYTFNQLFAETNSVVDSFGVEVYPTTIILFRNNVIFRGAFENAMKKIQTIQTR